MAPRETASLTTPIGIIRIDAQGDALSAITIGGEPGATSDNALLARAADQLEAYFAGELQQFDVPLLPPQTPRGLVLRKAIVGIGYGNGTSYGAIAGRIASSPRAIGQACARNPIPIIVPCHRVLGANHVLGAYSAGNGPSTKIWLLNHEKGLLL